jgi:hypothetical protein
MFGAPFGGTIRGGQAAFDCKAFSSIEPLNGCGGGGKYLPSIDVVALGEPGVPVVCWAMAVRAVRKTAQTTTNLREARSHAFCMFHIFVAPYMLLGDFDLLRAECIVHRAAECVDFG